MTEVKFEKGWLQKQVAKSVANIERLREMGFTFPISKVRRYDK